MITTFAQYLFESNKKMKMNLPKDVLDFKKEFDKAGKKLFVVGGAVRDHELGIEPHDFDLVTDAQPNEVKIILSDFDVSDEQGKNFGVVRVFTQTEKEGYEIATFRKDISKGRDNKGSDKKVEIGSDITIEDDVQRRDLTMNALFYDIGKGEVVDLVGGLNDIRKNKVKAVGDPTKRFDEDRLRILRTFRFASRNLSTVANKTAQAIKKDNRLRGISDIDDVSQERIIDEIRKTIKWSRDNDKIESLQHFFVLLDEFNMFDEMFPGVKINISGINTFTLSTIFAMLFRDNENLFKLKSKLKSFKIPNFIIDKSIFLLMFKDEVTDINKIPNLHKERKRIKISNFSITEITELFDVDRRFANAFMEFDPKIDGKEIIDRGFKHSEIGKEKQRLEIEEFKKLL